MPPVKLHQVSHVLLDIEGTTCPVSFVSETLFPYAQRQLSSYLMAHAQQDAVHHLLAEIMEIWRQDATEKAVELLDQVESDLQCTDRGEMQGTPDASALIPYIQLLIERDQKLTPLKDLQGLIWEEGYNKGDLVGPLFADVKPALEKWNQQGLVLAVYSSGSVKAQKLIYRHSNAGDLCSLFSHWFDTHIGLKTSDASYRAICSVMNIAPMQVLFISDSSAELNAAAQAGLQCLCSERPGNPVSDVTTDASRIDSFSQIELNIAD